VRIEPLSEPYPEDVAETLRRLMPPGVPPIGLFRVVGKNPRVLKRMQRGGLLDPGSISLRVRELVILRTTARCGAGYELGVHATFFGPVAKLSAEDVAAVVARGPADARWSDEERLALRLVDALHDHGDVDDDLWSALTTCYDEAQRIELVMLCGLYHAVSFLCRTLRLEPEPGTETFAALLSA